MGSMLNKSSGTTNVKQMEQLLPEPRTAEDHYAIGPTYFLEVRGKGWRLLSDNCHQFFVPLASHTGTVVSLSLLINRRFVCFIKSYTDL